MSGHQFQLFKLVTAEFLEGKKRNMVLSGCHWSSSFLSGANPCWPLLHRLTQWFQLSPPRRTPSRHRAPVSQTSSCWQRQAAGAWIPGVVLKGKTIVYIENTSSERNTPGRQTQGLPQKEQTEGLLACFGWVIPRLTRFCISNLMQKVHEWLCGGWYPQVLLIQQSS